MKNVLLILLASCLTTTFLFAQATFNTIDSVDINNINASVLVHGDMWRYPNNPIIPDCKFPNGSNKNLHRLGSIWLSGYDGTGNLHIAAQTYRWVNDYWPGPLDASDTLNYATSSSWAKIWKVNLTDIETFLSFPIHTTTNTPQSILTWPGKGNINATGNSGTPLTITSDMAPFVDLNGNGIYEPLLGEYPEIKGNQTLWWVFSDNGPTHNQTNGRPLGVEVHAMAYAFKRGTLIDNVVYYEYTIVNKSAYNYSNFRIAQWDDIQIGYSYPFEDFIGYDSIWRMAVDYSGTNCNGCTTGDTVNNYGANPPQTALTMIVLPGDAGTSYVPAGSFDYYVNDASIIGNPANDSEYDNYMRAKLRNSQHFTDDFSGAASPCNGYGMGANVNYLFTGDPSNYSQWSDCSCNNNPGDRRTVFSSNDFNLNAGSSQRVVFALLVADTAKGCPLASFNDIKIVADTAWGNYFQNASGIKNIINNIGVNIYPNPTHNLLYLENSVPNTGEENTTFYNIIGQKLNVPISGTGNKRVADLSGLPNGIYLVVYNDGTIQKTVKVIKE